jgi:hypothetical protein
VQPTANILEGHPVLAPDLLARDEAESLAGQWMKGMGDPNPAQI